MRCPTLSELPPPPPGKTGWPWTEESEQLPDVMPDGQAWSRVSIVTPSLDQGQFIEETIRSVLLQGYPDLEFIIMDGGSRDGSVDIIRKYESHLTYWVSEPDEGQADAIAKGWRMCSGDVLAYLNSDDIYLPGAVATAVDFLNRHPEIGVVYGECFMTDPAGKRLELYPTAPFDYDEVVEKGFNPIPQPSTFMSRAVIDRIGLPDPELHFAMDLDLWLRAGLHFRFANIPVPMATFRLHPVSKSATKAVLMGDDYIRIYRRLTSSPDLPVRLRHKERRLLARGFLMAAERYYQKGPMLAETRRCIIRAAVLDPSILGIRDVRALAVSLLGPVGRWMLQRWRKPIRYF